MYIMYVYIFDLRRSSTQLQLAILSSQSELILQSYDLPEISKKNQQLVVSRWVQHGPNHQEHALTLDNERSSNAGIGNRNWER